MNQATTTLAAPVESGPGSTTAPGPLLTTTTPTLSWNAITGQTGYQVNFYDVTTSQAGFLSRSASDRQLHSSRGRHLGRRFLRLECSRSSMALKPVRPAPTLFPDPGGVTLAAPTAISPGSTTSPGSGPDNQHPGPELERGDGEPRDISFSLKPHRRQQCQLYRGPPRTATVRAAW